MAHLSDGDGASSDEMGHLSGEIAHSLGRRSLPPGRPEEALRRAPVIGQRVRPIHERHAALSPGRALVARPRPGRTPASCLRRRLLPFALDAPIRSGAANVAAGTVVVRGAGDGGTAAARAGVATPGVRGESRRRGLEAAERGVGATADGGGACAAATDADAVDRALRVGETGGPLAVGGDRAIGDDRARVLARQDRPVGTSPRRAGVQVRRIEPQDRAARRCRRRDERERRESHRAPFQGSQRRLMLPRRPGERQTAHPPRYTATSGHRSSTGAASQR